MSSSRSNPGKAKKEGPNFHDAIAQVEAITDRIEQGEIGLEESIDQFEQGMELLKHCREILERTEQRVEDITQRLRETDAGEKTDPDSSDEQDSPR